MNTTPPPLPRFTGRHLDLLMFAALILWFIGGWPARFFPDVPVFATMEKVLPFVVGLLISSGLFGGLQLWSTRPTERPRYRGRLIAFLAFAVFALTLCLLLYAITIALPLMAKSAQSLTPILVEGLTDEDPTERKDMAQSLYILTGSAFPYTDAEGRKVTYQPTREEEKVREALHPSTATAEATSLASRGTFALLSASVYFFAIVAGGGGGLAAIALRKRRPPA